MLATRQSAIGAALERLAAMPAYVQSAIASMPAASLTARAPDGSFALVEQACHLRDLEREGYLVRARRMLAEPLAELVPFEGDVVARERDYLAQDAPAAGRDFAAARSELLALLAGVDEADLARAAMFEGRRITLADLVAMIEEHDHGHRAEIELLRGGAAR